MSAGCRAGLIEILTADPEIKIVGEASTGEGGGRGSVSGGPGGTVLILTTFEQDDHAQAAG
jgi:DNA-binding NarL/FixJ family response regulator